MSTSTRRRVDRFRRCIVSAVALVTAACGGIATGRGGNGDVGSGNSGASATGTGDATGLGRGGAGPGGLSNGGAGGRGTGGHIDATCFSQFCPATGTSLSCCVTPYGPCGSNINGSCVGFGQGTGGVTSLTDGGTDGAADSGGATSAGGAMGDGGVGVSGRSCDDLAATCGPGSNEDCCTSPVVPRGTFYRSYDGVTFTDQNSPATVSDFRLDKYEVTVGRFRKFVSAYSQNMIPAGTGKNPNGIGDPGWDTAWNTSLPADPTAVKATALCDARNQAWTDIPGTNENKAINCIDWFEAFAFCIWDGGRLPTEAEWNYAAAGGSEQRVYPWSVPANSTTIDCTYANYKGASGYCVLPFGSTNDVGSESPKGDGKWGQADLAGNVREWVLDFGALSYPDGSCENCANTTANPTRVLRGGGFLMTAGLLHSASRDYSDPTYPYADFGVRCARNP